MTIDDVREEIDEEGGSIWVCRGPEKGCEGKPEPCNECYVIEANDPRSTDEILATMNRGDA